MPDPGAFLGLRSREQHDRDRAPSPFGRLALISAIISGDRHQLPMKVWMSDFGGKADIVLASRNVRL